MADLRRVAVLTSHPIQYNAPFFRRLAGEPGIELTVLYCSMLGTSANGRPVAAFDRALVWDLDLLEGYRWKLLGNPVEADPQRRWTLLNPGIIGELRSRRYDAVVNYGWAYPADWLSFAVARRLGIPFLLYGDTDIRGRGLGRGHGTRAVAMRWLCQQAAGALYTGTFNRDFYIRHGMRPDALWFSPWAVESGRFEAAPREPARARLGLRPEVCYFLFVGTLIERKRPAMVVEAVAELQRHGHKAGLIVVGSGPLEDMLHRKVRELEVRDAHFLGFLNQSQLPEAYRASDVFVLPSRWDPRATVVNEAMSAGVPVVISTGTGVWGPGDLVKDGREGLVFRADVQRELVDACRRLLDPPTRRRMGLAARERVRRWSYDTALTGWLEALTSVTARSLEPKRGERS